jgi:hypothetical protein
MTGINNLEDLEDEKYRTEQGGENSHISMGNEMLV